MEKLPTGIINTNISGKRILKLLLWFFALGLIMYAVADCQRFTQQAGKKANREYEAKRQTIQKSRESAEHAREYWGKRYEDWENSVGNPPSLRGKRGELGLTPISYPTLGIMVIVNDDNQIIRVESR